ncbi:MULTISPECIES: amidohydrolase [Lysobacter]|uniref:amidohydrolase n=1 Tax=Lysobacter TaxID=68 RepID=UPI001F308F62|nr:MULTISPECIES: amidohydrolase [Lysobacter]UJB20593.1 amidohydrolase [Lysobacter capsici]UJQ30293.1 amidohydrolase [Lysobacter gummosus]
MLRYVLPVVLFSASTVATAAPVTVLTAARIHTMDPAQPRAQAMAYDAGGKILAAGGKQELLRHYPRARRLDMGAATVVPGLIDSHAHVFELGFNRIRADLTGARSKAEALQRLRDFAAHLQPGQWLLGYGWDQNDWLDPRFPNAEDLDTEFSDRPVWLQRIDGHAGWANSAAMSAVGRDLSGDWQPDGGRILRDDHGKPTGIFIDDAMALLEKARPPLDAAATERALTLGMQAAIAEGLTGVHDARVDMSVLRAYQRLADRKQLPLRITAFADGDDDVLELLCREGLYQHPSGRLKLRTVKLYADGALGSRGAAMLEDYSDDHGNRGLLRMSPDAMRTAIAKAKRCGVQVATHAIGDRGNRQVLDLYEQALGADARRGDHRWRIEHAQIIAAQDLPRLAAMHVIAAMQPTHATSDMPWAEQRIGPARINGAYAWRQLRDSGARLALGSDFPVESADPRLGLYATVTRADADGKPLGGWHPEEKLTAFEALRGFTLDAAYAGFAEGEVGSLAVGKRADFVVLEQDPLAVEPGQLRDLKLLGTYVDGARVWKPADSTSTK